MGEVKAKSCLSRGWYDFTEQ